jgi:hypothetical protein
VYRADRSRLRARREHVDGRRSGSRPRGRSQHCRRCACVDDGHQLLTRRLRRRRRRRSGLCAVRDDRRTRGEDSNSDCAENSLDAIYLAASSCPWRTGATRILIHVTDDTFAERPAILSDESAFGGTGIPVQHTYDEVVTELRSAEVRVGSFAAPGAGEECGAGMSANVGEGFHEPYRGRDSLPVATGGRVWSIRDVRAGGLNMATAISEMVASEYCTLY